MALGLYLLDVLDATDRLEVERHLPMCRVCSTDLEYIKDIPTYLGLLRSNSSDAPAAPGRRRCQHAQRLARSGRDRKPRLARRRRGGPVNRSHGAFRTDNVW
jgi:hypothetical protein